MTTRKQVNPKKQLPRQFMDAKLMNLKEDVHLQQRLDLIDHKFRLVCRGWTQERAFILREQRKLLCLRVCEPYACVDKTMEEISEVQKDHLSLLGLHSARPTSQRRLHSCRFISHESTKVPLNPCCCSSSILRPFNTTPTDETTPTKQGPLNAGLRRPKSAATSLLSTAISRHLNMRTEPLSKRQLREMAAIDCISRKEVASRAEKVRQERERLQVLLRSKLNHKVQTFLKKLENDSQAELMDIGTDGTKKHSEET